MTFPRFLSGLAPLLLLAGSCQEEQVSHSRIAKVAEAAPPSAQAPFAQGAAPPGQGAMAGSAMPGSGMAGPAPSASAGMAGEVPTPPKPSGAGSLTWTLPKGWTQALTGGMRFATLKPSVPGKVDVSVVVLAGQAGGELANVNRWRSQLGLAPLAQEALGEALGSARKTLATQVGPVALYDFTSEGTQKTRLVAGLATSADNSWFFKMTGDAEPVAKALPDFMKLVQSLRPQAGAN